jgi:hypothetical protein
LLRGCACNVNVTGFTHTAVSIYCAFASLYFKVSVFAKFIAKALGYGNRSFCVFNAKTAEDNIASSVHNANLLALTHIERIISSKRKRVTASGWADNRCSARQRVRRGSACVPLFLRQRRCFRCCRGRCCWRGTHSGIQKAL